MPVTDLRPEWKRPRGRPRQNWIRQCRSMSDSLQMLLGTWLVIATSGGRKPRNDPSPVKQSSDTDYRALKLPYNRIFICSGRIDDVRQLKIAIWSPKNTGVLNAIYRYISESMIDFVEIPMANDFSKSTEVFLLGHQRPTTQNSRRKYFYR